MEKKNTGLIVLVVILSLLVLGLGGFIIYDKVINNVPNNNEISKEEVESDNKVYIEKFDSSMYIKSMLKSFSKGNNDIDENNVVKSLYHMFSDIRTSDEYFESFDVRNLDLSPFIIGEYTNEEIKEYHNFMIYYISEENLNKITKNVFNYDFKDIKTKFIEEMKTDPFNVFGEYNNGYIFARKGMGGSGYNYEFESNSFTDDSKIYNYNIYCSIEKSGTFELIDTKIGEVEVTSKYNKDLQSFIITKYNYKIDETIDTKKCFIP